ncbi:5-guanidino-2-oxopentanoate decarboxylase [Mesorhizobium sp. NBSH29]|uniref:5-guanidino-2-oxopentanoate decarboxylase n=1 Tax=Mesorhizobium sp. NBSH29 TaxID=2654249 RepID=UPI001896A106|nr:5-guanidino-2-oxopentanoate decarboxylase [Mesorhizobium sp. NBSH29]QPC86291.1 5-guanidino-2-oxopentanoate decarboxylase [Mesorhizobium sp. NBSH29]
MTPKTTGEALITLLEAHGVDTVFGIPGVHTIELYRGLAGSSIRHITPRHEQGAAFMADGYARASGKPGVALVITGPGLTNTITAMAQARADSVPMLVISGVNRRDTLGKGLGLLHELSDQRGLMEKVALSSQRIESPAELEPALARAFEMMRAGRPGPVHIEIPTDVMGLPAAGISSWRTTAATRIADAEVIKRAETLIAASKAPLILAGGGARKASLALKQLAEQLDAPVVMTANGRGLLYAHRLAVPASPSLKAVRKLMAEADLVIAVGTEFGPTDYDMYVDGGFVCPPNLIRIDIDAVQLARWPATLAIEADAKAALEALVACRLAQKSARGSERAEVTRDAAWVEIGPDVQAQAKVVEMIRDVFPGSFIVGDSTQPVYAANLYYDHDRAGGWFNAATGYGALGFGPPAAIGAAIAEPGVPVISLSGDGGFQFSFPEIGAAIDAEANVIFVIWNNHGYREIETSMRDAGVEPVGVSPAPPDFCRIADAYNMPAERLVDIADLPGALSRAAALRKPCLIEIMVP